MDNYVRIPTQVFTMSYLLSRDLQKFKMPFEIQADKIIILVSSRNAAEESLCYGAMVAELSPLNVFKTHSMLKSRK